MIRVSDQSESLLLKARQCAALCGVSERQWARWNASGEVPTPIRKGRRCVRWHRNEVVEWVRAGMPSRAQWDRKQALTAQAKLVG